MQVRDAVGADVDAVRAVFRRASLSNAGDRAALLAEPETLEWDAAVMAAGRTRVAVEDGGGIVGFATAVPVDGALELEDLFVEPTWMRRGVASRLVEDVLAHAAGRDVSTVYVSANPHAVAFYTAVGFRPHGTAQTRFGPVSRLRLDLADIRP